MSITAPQAGPASSGSTGSRSRHADRGDGERADPAPLPGRRRRLVTRPVPELRAEPTAVVRALAPVAGRRRLAVLSGAWLPGTVLTADPTHTRELLAPAPHEPQVSRLLAALDDSPTLTAASGAIPPGAVGGGWLTPIGHALGRGTGRVRVPPPAAVGPALPTAVLAWHDHVLRHDDSDWWAEALDDGTGEAVERARALAAEAVANVAAGVTAGPDSAVPLARLGRLPDEARHLKAVERCVSAIRAGEIAQTNVCTRFDLQLRDGAAGAVAAWTALVEQLRPAHAALLTGPWGALVSASPELYLRLEPTPLAAEPRSAPGSGPPPPPRPSSRVTSAPIKGTQPLGREDALAASAKDSAENIMIVDLLRNDLSRVCRPGSVDVSALLRVESHAGVAHLVSRVEGEVTPPTGVGGVIAATFPPASVTGTPKLRATELTNDLEPAARGGAHRSRGPGLPAVHRARRRHPEP